MTWQQWRSVAFTQRQLLPTYSGIYVVADASHFVWYVGQANNLQSRWQGRAHHRYAQLIRTNKRLAHRIFWQPFPSSELDTQERFFIEQLRPELNGCKVKTYLPKQPQVEREIKRLFKVLNRTTLLFPELRSLVVGEYVDEAGRRCVLTAIFSNDAMLLAKSMRKRGPVKQAWVNSECLCGYSAAAYEPVEIATYDVGGVRYEFVTASDLLRFVENSLRGVGKAELVGVEVAALRSLDVLGQVTLQTAFSAIGDGKQRLRDEAYLHYRARLLVPVQSLAEQTELG